MWCMFKHEKNINSEQKLCQQSTSTGDYHSDILRSCGKCHGCHLVSQ